MKKKAMEPEAVRILKRDHKRITDLLFHFEQTEDPNHKLSFAETALNELAIHTVIEQECIYPLLDLQDRKKLSKHVHHIRKQQERMDDVMAKLSEKEHYDEEYEELFGKLTEMFKKHIAEDEKDILPKLAKIPSRDLGDRMNQLRSELLELDHPTEKDFSPQVLLFEQLRSRIASA